MKAGFRTFGVWSTAVATCSLLAIAPAMAQGVKIGILNDQSGVYADYGGKTSVEAAKMAIEDFGGEVLGQKIELVTADHQNKPDLASTIARKWYDTEGVDMITDLTTSSVALAVQEVAKEKKKIDIVVGAATSAITGAACTPYGFHWAFDTHALAVGTGGAMVKAGGDSWYFLTADYAFGKQLQADTTGFVKAAHGTVKGASLYPFPETTDYSSFLVQAQASGAKVLGLANAGADTVNSIKQAHEFGLDKSMKIAALLMFITDVHALGLEVAQGLNLTESFYWDLNDRTRAFTKRVLPKTPTNYPNMIHAGCYSGTLHYLKAVADMGAAAAKKDGVATVNRMKAMPVDDDCFGKTKIREDGRNLVPSYLFEVKKPSESKGPWDYYKMVIATPGDEAFRPLSEGHCPFVKA